MSRKRLTALALADALQGTEGDDLLTGTAGEDTLFGGLGHDTLLGRAGMDWLEGGAGNDTLDGNSGADHMIGGAGDDLYVVDDAADVVVEASGEGTDTVRSSLSFSLSRQYIENLTLTGIDAISGTGNALANTIIGNIAANRLVGGGGNDVLDGRGGADIMEGGTGSDTYHVDTPEDRVIEVAGEGTDTIVTGLQRYSLEGLETVERLKGTGTENGTFVGTGNALDNVLESSASYSRLYGGAGNDTLTGAAGNDELSGDEGDDTLEGAAGYDRLYGGEGIDTLHGAAGDDYLDGGAGADRMKGGDGNDVYVIDHSGDVIVETRGAGTDRVIVSIDFSMSGRYVEALEMSGNADLTATGNALENVMRGNAGHNTLLGMGRSDILYGGEGNDRLDGGEGNDWLYGENGNDVLYGGAGKDKLSGGSGMDLFHLDGVGDSIEDFRHGVDLIVISAAWLGGGLEAGLEVGLNGFFAGGTAASGTGHGQFVFLPGTGWTHNPHLYNSPAQLIYDANGAEAGGETLVATLNYNAAVTASDLVIVA